MHLRTRYGRRCRLRSRACASAPSHLAGKAEAAGARFAAITVELDHVGVEALAALVDNRQLSVHVEGTFPFEDAADAHRLVESGHVTGKVVLTP